MVSPGAACSIAIWMRSWIALRFARAGERVGGGLLDQPVLREPLLSDVGARADQELVFDAAAAAHELVAKQEQPLAMHRFDAPFDLVRFATVEEVRADLVRDRAVV
ncbi:hypothetical protein OKW49_002144 [Paraburkholderia youngii]